MRARIIAIGILFLLVVLPFGIYFFLTEKQTSSLEISLGSGAVFSAELIGSFGVDGLPLADKALKYRQECEGSCIISPVLPATYHLVITSPGKVSITDDFVLKIGQKYRRQYVLKNDIETIKIGNISNLDISLTGTTLDRLDQNSGSLSLIGADASGGVWVSQNDQGKTQIGTLSGSQIKIHRSYGELLSDVHFDLLHQVLLLSFSSGKKVALATDLSHEIELDSINQDILAVDFFLYPKIRTHSGVYEVKNDLQKENIRFTDYVDISPAIRIGYIARDDTRKLSLSNFAPDNSVLLWMDREKNETFVLRTGLDILALGHQGDIPVYITPNGDIWKMSTSF